MQILANHHLHTSMVNDFVPLYMHYPLANRQVFFIGSTHIANFNQSCVRRMGRKLLPRVRDNNPIGTQRTVSVDFEEE